MPLDLLRKKPLVETYLRKAPYRLSSFSFVNIFAWKDFFDFRFEVIDGNLCVFASSAVGTFLYLPPLGKNISGKAVSQCFEVMEKENKGSGVTRIENVEEDMLPFFWSEKFKVFKKSEEYVYRRKDIANLKGNTLKTKRSLYNYFAKYFSFEYSAFETPMADECLSLYERWAKERKESHKDEIYRHLLDENRAVHKLLLAHGKDLELVGRVIRMNGKIKAYTFGCALNPQTFCILLEIADLKIKGLPVTIFREFAKDKEVQKFEFINVMDDFGLESVRRTKLSFRPCGIIPSYVATRKPPL